MFNQSHLKIKCFHARYYSMAERYIVNVLLLAKNHVSNGDFYMLLTKRQKSKLKFKDMKKSVKKVMFMFVLLCSFSFIAPQNANSIPIETGKHVWRIEGEKYVYMGFNTYFRVVHLTMRDGSKMSNIYDRDGNFVNSASGWL